ncbi:MAG: class I SAM-dependent methyltransferase [Ilumatobacteraceae bacterium]
MPGDYVQVNLANWNSRVPLHEVGYRLDAYRNDPTHLSAVVRFDRDRLFDVTGLDGVHLQCHIGTDTLSLARLGARMTGLDFSAPALDVARRLAADTGATIEYVEAELYGAVDALDAGRFDFVYTGIGALCWLPDIRRWAGVVAELLRPGGRLFMREGHPVLWSMSDPRPDGLLVVEYPYFEVPGGTAFCETVTYVDHVGELASPDTIGFNHGLGEIVGALLAAGMRLTMLDEHDSVPWNALGDLMVADADEEWRLRSGRERLALTYTVQAVKE